MKKLFIYSLVSLILIGTSVNSFAQATTAMDFNRADCNGVMHHLFTNDLDSGNVVILEFFMGGGCISCITAGQDLETMKTGLLAAYPGKIRSYASGYTNSMNCSTVFNWVNSNGFTSTPIDSGATQVAYYGGFGMPTIVILAGNDHKVIYTGIGYSASDTVTMKTSVNNFFNPSAVQVAGVNNAITTFNLYPNPTRNTTDLSLQLKENGLMQIYITDVTGKIIYSSSEENASAGHYSKTLNTRELANGLYVVGVTFNGQTSYTKLSIAK